MQFFNQYSYIAVSLFALLVSAGAAYLWLPLPGGLLVVVLVGVGVVAVGAGLRYREADVASGTGLDELIGNGRPALVAVFSNY